MYLRRCGIVFPPEVPEDVCQSEECVKESERRDELMAFWTVYSHGTNLIPYIYLDLFFFFLLFHSPHCEKKPVSKTAR